MPPSAALHAHIKSYWHHQQKVSQKAMQKRKHVCIKKLNKKGRGGGALITLNFQFPLIRCFLSKRAWLILEVFNEFAAVTLKK